MGETGNAIWVGPDVTALANGADRDGRVTQARGGEQRLDPPRWVISPANGCHWPAPERGGQSGRATRGAVERTAWCSQELGPQSRAHRHPISALGRPSQPISSRSSLGLAHPPFAIPFLPELFCVRCPVTRYRLLHFKASAKPSVSTPAPSFNRTPPYCNHSPAASSPVLPAPTKQRPAEALCGVSISCGAVWTLGADPDARPHPEHASNESAAASSESAQPGIPPANRPAVTA